MRDIELITHRIYAMVMVRLFDVSINFKIARHHIVLFRKLRTFTTQLLLTTAPDRFVLFIKLLNNQLSIVTQ